MKLRINQSLGARHLAFPFLSLSLIYDHWMIYERAISFSSLMIHLGVFECWEIDCFDANKKWNR